MNDVVGRPYAAEDAPKVGEGEGVTEKVGFGDQVGAQCWRNGCAGIICERIVDGCCSCHISAPCGFCTTNREWCPECGWKASDHEYHFNGYIVTPGENPEDAWKSWKPRPLDPRQIDWHSRSHSNSSMIKEGVYPPGTTANDVVEKVRGTFGGRFESFGGGKFKYIAYTD